MAREDILDMPVKKRKYRWTVHLLYAAVALFAYWFAAGPAQWPFASAALSAGLACMLGVAAGRYLMNRRAGRYTLLYLSGRILLIVGIAVHINAWADATWFFWAAFACFAAGLFMLRRK